MIEVTLVMIFDWWGGSSGLGCGMSILVSGCTGPSDFALGVWRNHR